MQDPPRPLATSNFFPTPWVTEQSRCLSGKSSLPTTDISLKRRQRKPGVQAVTCGLLVSGSLRSFISSLRSRLRQRKG
ncbi:hypothetical protein AVEN_22366-1, partial [Araneus ventricosus]